MENIEWTRVKSTKAIEKIYERFNEIYNNYILSFLQKDSPF